MSSITKNHFGGNVILTLDDLEDQSPYGETLKEIDFHNIRYPGGGVTEGQTWENGGLQKMFGAPMDANSEGHVLTLRETLLYASESGQSVSIVIPTFQFYDVSADYFDTRGFKAYISELQKALSEYPSVKISSFEIGNEYWGSKNWGGLDPSDYGKIANFEIPLIKEMIDSLWNGTAEQPLIGVQAGVQWKAEQSSDGTWKAVGPAHSADIIEEISLVNRQHVGAVFQHSYPDAENIEQSVNWAVRPMNVFENAIGFPENLKLILSEFNIGENTAVGVAQGAAWIDAFSKFIDAGITDIDNWGVSYAWLSNKLYDIKFSPAESGNGEIKAIATPAGQLYDIAERHLIGSNTITDIKASDQVSYSSSLEVTAFSKPGQTISFYYNTDSPDAQIFLSEIPSNLHVSTFHIVAADSPYSDWYDESISNPLNAGKIVDARGDMKVNSGVGPTFDYDINENEIVVVVVSDSSRDLFIEGAHNVTDPRTGMVDDIIKGARGNDVLFGHVGNDRMYGGDGKNLLAGGKGSDFLVAGKSGDIIISDGGDDTVVGGYGNDLILLSSMNGALNSSVSGGDGRNLFVVSDNTSVVINDFSARDFMSFGGAFKNISEFRDALFIENNDLLISMPEGGSIRLKDSASFYYTLGNHVMDFEKPEDRQDLLKKYFLGFSDYQIDEIFSYSENKNSALNWLSGEAKESLKAPGGIASDLDDGVKTSPVLPRSTIGTPYNDILKGGLSDSIIIGKNGDDIIYSESGNDYLTGNFGDDLIYGADGKDSIYGGSGLDTVHGGGGDDSLFGGADDDDIYGNEGADFILGGSGNDVVFGGNGGDLIAGGYGTDKIFGGLGNDMLVGNDGADYIHGGLGNDLIKGGSGDDILDGWAGDDWLNGGSGNDLLDGGMGNDWVWFRGEIDAARVDLTLVGPQATGHGMDVIKNIENIHGGLGNDVLLGDAQANIIRGGNGADRIMGRSGDDILEGNQGADVISGDMGHDILNGGEGYDILNGGVGNDWLTGGAGSDLFIFEKNSDQDIVFDFQDGVDTISLFDFGISNFAQARAFATQSGSSVVFDFGEGDILTVHNTTVSALSDDLLFV